MTEKLIQIIKYDSESATLDFKAQEYALGQDVKKNEFLKDISAMANHPSDEPKYILIGVIEENGSAKDFRNVENITDQAKYQQFVDDNIEPKINFEYKSFEYDNFKLAAFIISNNKDRPYLFKKEVKSPGGSATEYRRGDGYIRTGTSTKKLTRPDFDIIYKTKLAKVDRKSDVKIIPYIKKIHQIILEEKIVFFTIDFTIDNTSGKSIGFDLDLRVYGSQIINITKKFDLDQKKDQKGLKGIYPQYFFPETDPTLFDLYIDDKQEFWKVSRLKKGNEKYTINISQKDSEQNIFFDQVILMCRCSPNEEDKITLELTLRSDEFSEGPLIQKYELDTQL